jgi:hypothetical protein
VDVVVSEEAMNGELSAFGEEGIRPIKSFLQAETRDDGGLYLVVQEELCAVDAPRRGFPQNAAAECLPIRRDGNGEFPYRVNIVK